MLVLQKPAMNVLANLGVIFLRCPDNIVALFVTIYKQGQLFTKLFVTGAYSWYSSWDIYLRIQSPRQPCWMYLP